MATKLDRKHRLLRVGGYPRKGMIGDVTELAAWEMAVAAGTKLRNWDAGHFMVTDEQGRMFWYARRRDDSWTERTVPQSHVKLNRKKRLHGIGAYNIHSMMGEHSELRMYELACTHNVTCAEWDAGGFTLVEHGFKNRYEREPDGSWANARTVALNGTW